MVLVVSISYSCIYTAWVPPELPMLPYIYMNSSTCFSASSYFHFSLVPASPSQWELLPYILVCMPPHAERCTSSRLQYLLLFSPYHSCHSVVHDSGLIQDLRYFIPYFHSIFTILPTSLFLICSYIWCLSWDDTFSLRSTLNYNPFPSLEHPVV